MPNHGDTKTQRKTLKNSVTLCLITLWAVIQIGLSGLVLHRDHGGVEKQNYFVLGAAVGAVSAPKFVAGARGYTWLIEAKYKPSIGV